jgi:hypothetical protein
MAKLHKVSNKIIDFFIKYLNGTKLVLREEGATNIVLITGMELQLPRPRPFSGEGNFCL